MVSRQRLPPASQFRPARDLAAVLYETARVLRVVDFEAAGLVRLPASELEAVRYVLTQPGIGVGELARALGLHASNVSTTVRRLAARGLINRTPSPGDRRSVQLTPTLDAVHGMALIEQAWAELLAPSLEDLSPGHRADIAAALPALQALSESLRTRLAHGNLHSSQGTRFVAEGRT